MINQKSPYIIGETRGMSGWSVGNFIASLFILRALEMVFGSQITLSGLKRSSTSSEDYS